MFHLSGSRNQNRTRKNRQGGTRRFRLEKLEDRVLLAVMAGSECGGAEWSEPAELTGPMEPATPTGKTVVVNSLTQSALMIALTNAADGDTITFHSSLSGTLNLSYALSITKSVTIDGGGVITLNGRGTNQIFTVNAASKSVTLTGLTFTGGYADVSANTFGGALYANGTGLNLTISDCHFTANTANGYGGALYLTNTGFSTTIINTDFTENSVTYAGGWGSGGAVYVGSDNTVTFDNVTMTGNTVNAANAFGGAVNVEAGAVVTITASSFSQNKATGTSEFAFGGAICSSVHGAQTITIKSTSFDGNGAYTTQSYGCSAGGAICNTYGDLVVSDSTFSSNVSSTTGARAFGGAVVIKDNTSAAFTGTTMVYNVATGTNAYGGALYVMKCDAMTVSRSQFAFNEAKATTGQARGGAVCAGVFTYDNGKGVVNLKMDYTTLSFNRAVSMEGTGEESLGGALYSASGYTAEDEKMNSISTCYVMFESNAAVGSAENAGGGVYNEDALTLQSTFIMDNYVGDTSYANQNARGGGIYHGGIHLFEMMNSLVAGNEAGTAGGTAQGGGIWNSGVQTLYYNTISSNRVLASDQSGQGGGIYDSGASTVVGSIVVGNLWRTATEEKGASEVWTIASGENAFAFRMSLVNTAGNVTTGDAFLYSFMNSAGTTIDSVYYTEGTPLFEEGNWLPAEGSAVIDQIDMVTYGDGFTDVNGTNLFDLRGINYRRVVNGVTDIGCFERQASEAQQEAASAVVTTLSDTVDGTDGLISLREAILYVVAFGNEIGTTITFDASLAGGTVELDATLGEISIATSMTIDAGDGITVDGLGNSRVFKIDGASDTAVLFRGLTITGGFAVDNGAGVLINEAGSVSFQACVITENDVISTGTETVLSVGAGIANMRFAELSLTGSTVSSNTVLAAQYALGAGIYNNWGTLKITDGILTGNMAQADAATAYGGGIYNLENTGSYINSTLFENNIAVGKSASGGALATKSGRNMTIADSRFSGNQAQATASGGVAAGGGIYVGPFNGSAALGTDLYVSNTEIVNNLATTSESVYGRAIVMATRGGGLYNGDNSVTLYRCDIRGNRSVGAESSEGGGIYNASVLQLELSFLTGNEAGTLDHANSFATGGGLYNTSNAGSISYLFNSLIADNIVYSSNRNDYPTGGGIANFGGAGLVSYFMTLAGNKIVTRSGIDSFGAGIYDEAATAFVTSIVIGNTIEIGTTVTDSDVYTMAQGTAALQMKNCLVHQEANFSEGSPILYVFTEDGKTIDCSYYQTGDVVFTDAANGDYSLADGSIAVDKTGEDHAFTYDWDIRGEGFARVVNEIVDYGCYEYQASSPAEPLAVPANVKVSSFGANRKMVSWDAVENAVGYRVAYSTDEAVWTTVTSAETSCPIVGLTYGTRLYFRVQAVGDGVQYADSDPSASVAQYVCPMDIDGDGRIGPADRSALSAAWFTRSTSSAWDVRADIDADGFIGPTDRNYLSLNWMKSATSPSLTYPAAKADAVFADNDFDAVEIRGDFEIDLFGTDF